VDSLFFSVQKFVRKQVDDLFADWVKNESQWNSSVAEAAIYSLVGAGKALRPAWVVWSYLRSQKTQTHALQISQIPRRVLNCALAVEMIHTYSLIHDDLPAMDNDDWRRGKPTSHKKYGEALAILVGDSLLTGAFEILSRDKFSNPLNQLLCFESLSKASGAAGLIGGQVRDISNLDKSFAELAQTHKQKTGALFAASLLLGALCTENKISQNSLKSMELLGLEFGYFFQLSDDLLDVKGNSQLMGKTAKTETILLKAPMLNDESSLASELDKARMQINILLDQSYPDQNPDSLKMEMAEILEYLVKRVN
jgi:geranylgeranyl diphosphate synthase type II